MITRSARLIAYPTIIDAVPSRSTMTNAVCVAALSMVSMIVSSEMLAITVSASGLPGRPAHWESGLFGSASMTVTAAPWLTSSVASRMAAVDLPTPPLGLANTMVGIGRRHNMLYEIAKQYAIASI